MKCVREECDFGVSNQPWMMLGERKGGIFL